MAKEWTTKLDTALASRFGVEVHTACYVPGGWAGKGASVCLGLPECELVMTLVDDAGVVKTLVNQPQINRDVSHWVQAACETAIERRAVVLFNCDTAEQLAAAILQAEPLLPGYERVALERMYDPQSRSKKGLS